MKKIDFIGQTIIFLLAIVAIYNVQIHFEYWPSNLLVGPLEFIIGLWQITSAIVILIDEKKTFEIKIYFVIVILFIITCMLFKEFYNTNNIVHVSNFNRLLSAAWLIAIYYYIITGIRTFKKQKS